MIIETTFLLVAVILFVGFFGEKIFAKTKIPDVIWLIIIGIILGSGLNLVSPDMFTDVAPLFTTFALIYLLFEGGLNIDIKKFLKSAPRGLLLSVLSFIFTWIILTLIGWVLGLPIMLALLTGAILGGISSAVVLPIINNVEVSNRTRLSLIFDSAFSDVLSILAAVTLIEIALVETINGWAIAHTLVASFAIALALGLVFGFVWTFISKRYLKGTDRFYILTLALMLMLYAITQLIKGNGAIACLVFGLIIGNSRKIAHYRENLITQSGRAFYSEIAFFIKTFFFVYLGILINFSSPWSFLIGFLMVVGIYIARPFAVYLSLPKDTKLKEVKLTETLVPKGLAAAVLIQLAIQSGVPGSEALANIILSVILLSIIASSIFVYLVTSNKYNGMFSFLYTKYKDHKPEKLKKEIKEKDTK